MKFWFGFFIFWQLLFPIFAKQAANLSEDPVIEQRLLNITKELRCLVCQNESLADSRADLANDLRREVRNLIKSGKSDNEIKKFLVNRYGDFILYRPPFKTRNLLLWFGPLLLLLGVVWLLIKTILNNQENTTSNTLDETSRIQAQALLEQSDSLK